MSFPGQIKQALGQWRAGAAAVIDDRRVQVVQGTSPGGSIATLYFDPETGLLVRHGALRFARRPRTNAI